MSCAEPADLGSIECKVISVNNAYYIKNSYLFILKNVQVCVLTQFNASTTQTVILKWPAYGLTSAEVKTAVPLQLLSCHSHVYKLMFMLLQHPFMVQCVILLMALAVLCAIVFEHLCPHSPYFVSVLQLWLCLNAPYCYFKGAFLVFFLTLK